MVRVLKLSLLVVLCLVTWACGSSDCNLSDSLCSCSISASQCADYEGKTTESAKSDCSSASGTYSDSGSCTTTGRVGTCKISLAGASTYNRYYSDAVTNEAGCTLSALGTGFLGTVEWTSN